MNPLPTLLPLSEEKSKAVPFYELRAKYHGPDDWELEVWQIPSPATPQIKTPVRIAGLRGRNLALIEHRVWQRLAKSRIQPSAISSKKSAQKFPLGEEDALNLGLLFRVMAPMRNRDNMRACAVGIEAMGREEAAYWLGMTMHRKFPRRVLTALRVLLTDPKSKNS